MKIPAKVHNVLIAAALLVCASTQLVYRSSAASGGKTYYAAITGKDSNPGTLSAPFRTIGKAAGILAPGDTCVIRGGEYRETVVPAQSGSAGNPITYQAFQGETVTLSGAEPVTGWERQSGSLYKATMPWDLGKDNQVFVDGKPMDEARWPNNADGDPMTPDGAKIDDGGDGYLISKSLPDGLPDDYWKGAVIWVMAGDRWTSWTSTVTAYSAREKKLVFPMPTTDWVANHHKPKNGEFYLVGKLEQLDAPNEWYRDARTNSLYVWMPQGDDPGRRQVTAKKRMLAIDLNNRAYVRVIGIDVRAATIAMEGARHCLLQGIRALYISHTRGGKTDASLGEKTGIYVTGSNNTIRDSEIGFSAGSGVSLGGEHNSVINCWIHHTDYTGSYACLLQISGTGHLVSHNTLHDTGRDGVHMEGTQHLVEYNNIYHSGMIARDQGLIYQVANDGEGTEIHHNWLHDNIYPGVPPDTCKGLYLDNFTSNYLLHHNVIWNSGNRTLNLNKPSGYNLAFNNTVLGNIGHKGRWPTDRMFGVQEMNNLVTGQIMPHPDLFLSHNMAGAGQAIGPAGQAIGPAGQAIGPDDFCSDKPRPGVDGGVVIPGITDGYSGKAPDLGACESGQSWKAGHDFQHPPHPEYHLTRIHLSNRIRNGGFERATNGVDIPAWTKTRAKAARIIRGASGIENHPDERLSFIGQAVELGSAAEDGIEQEVSGLEPHTRFTFAGWVKIAGGATVRIGVRSAGGVETHQEMAEGKWRLLTVDFTTEGNSPSVTVYVLKLGPGSAYADEFGVVPALTPGLRGATE